MRGQLSRGLEPDYVVTGNPDPNITGNYFEAEPWEEYPTYKHETLDWYIWLYDGYAFVISDIVGDFSDQYGFFSVGQIRGPYEGQGGCTGTCVATPYGE